MSTYRRDDLRRVFFSDLSEQCDEAILYELCIQFGPVQRIKWPTTITVSGAPQRMTYCFVDFENAEDAKYCYQVLNRARVKLFNRDLRVSHASTEIAQRESGAKVGTGRHLVYGLHEVGAKVVVRNVDLTVTEFELTRFFESFGPFAVPPRMLRDAVGAFRGTAILSYRTFEASDKVIAEMDQKVYRDRVIAVRYAELEDGSGQLHGSAAERANAALIREEERKYNEKLTRETMEKRKERQHNRASDASWADTAQLYPPNFQR